MNGKSKHGLRAAVAAGVAGLLLTGCGGGGKSAATTPDGWSTLDTERLSVAYPKDFKKVEVRKGNPYEVARVALTEGGTMVAAMSVEFDYGSLNTAKMAAVGAEARIQLGATPAKTTEIKVAGPNGPEDAYKITYTFSAKGRAGEPPKGTKLEGVMLAGVDDQSRPFLITVNSKPGTLSNRDVSDIVDSVTLKKTK